jgi:protein associated with RNAse G/E
MEKYNGWTNYETWRVNLELFDGWGADQFDDGIEIYEAADILKNHATEILESEGTNGLTFDYAMAFLSAVNWYEIARHMINDFAEEN